MKKFFVRAERAVLKVALSPELRPVERDLVRKAIVRFASSTVVVAVLSVLADRFLA
jgi:hypothetical protein